MNYQYYEYDSNDNGTGGQEPNYGGGYNPYQDPIKPKKPKKERPFLKTLGKTVAIALVFGLVAGCVFEGVSYVASKKLGTENVAETAATTLTTSNGTIDSTATSTATTVTDVSDIAENAMPAIVQVTNMSIVEYRSWFGQNYQQESESAGSGIIISQDDTYLYIATNNHVVEGATSLTITFCDESAVEAEIQGTDADTDLAVVKVKIADISEDTMSAIKVATLGSSDDLKVGSSAVVIGNALGYGQSVTGGMISALARDVTFENSDGTTNTQTLIQTDAAVNPGNSGGALLNMNGEVIGIVSAKYSDTDVEGMGYAIPISTATTVIEALINGQEVTTNDESTEVTGNGAYLGIAGVDLDSQTAYQYNMPTGVYVAQVVSGSGSEEAGIEKGDVITAFNNVDITSMAELQELLAQCNPGDTVSVSVAKASNNYAIATVQVTLGEQEQES
ncbi:MAG: trypsin-like peptidase domain-containing protein [Lachnospiraceae bacterium]|nr:trypsin-like peptidase domain-containing protein [Lachnospiraceae bacterium]